MGWGRGGKGMARESPPSTTPPSRAPSPMSRRMRCQTAEEKKKSSLQGEAAVGQKRGYRFGTPESEHSASSQLSEVAGGFSYANLTEAWTGRILRSSHKCVSGTAG